MSLEHNFFRTELSAGIIAFKANQPLDVPFNFTDADKVKNQGKK